MSDVYCDNKRIVAPSYGYSLIPVLIHARRAWLLQLVQDLALTALVIASAVYVPLSAAVLAAVSVLVVAGRNAATIARDYYVVATYERFREREAAQVRLKRWTTAALVAAVGLVAALSYAVRQTRLESRTWSSPRGYPAQAVVLVLLAGAIVALTSWTRSRLVHRLDREGALRVPARGHRLRIVAQQQRYLCSVHNGDEPFIGSGRAVFRWGFAQRLVRPKSGFDLPQDLETEFVRPPFRTRELIDRLRKAFAELADEANPETMISGLKVRDHILIESRRVGQYRSMLTAKFDPSAVDTVVSEPKDAARHHLACQVVAWGGDIVTTVFVHVSLQGRTLYLECSTHALAPVTSEFDDEYVDDGEIEERISTSPKTPGGVAHALLFVPTAPVRVGRALATGWTMLQAGRDLTADLKPGASVGPLMSLRELAARNSDRKYFQSRDILKHSRIIERRLLAAVEDFLILHGVDTSEFRNRAMAILNNGVINTGSGDVNTNGTVMGENNQVTGPAPAAAATTAGE